MNRVIERPPSVLRRDMTVSTVDGTAFSVMVGIGEAYLAAFVVAATASRGAVAAGLVTTIPRLVGAVLQLAAPAAIRRVGALRPWIVFCVSVQAASFLPLVVMAWTGVIPVWAVFLTASVYWTMGMASGPAWITWVAWIFPRRVRGRYFGRRSLICQLGVLVGLAGGGLTLEYGRDVGREIELFGVLFLVAAGCRTVSAVFLSMYSEPGSVPPTHRSVGAIEVLRRLGRGGDTRFLSYLLLVQFSAQIAQPFFTPYMLVELKFSYREYLALMGATFIAKALTQPIWGGLAHRWGQTGVTRLLWVGGMGIVPLPALWLVSDSFTYLLAVQLVSGMLWGAYELGMLLQFFDVIHEDERTSLLSLFNFCDAIAMAGGSLLGGLLLKVFGTGSEAYATIFLLSLGARLATVLYLTRTRTHMVEPAPIVVEADAVRPGMGSIDVPIMRIDDDGPEQRGRSGPD